MSGSKEVVRRFIRTWVRGTPRLGMLCGALAVVIWANGCVPTPTCTVDVDCTDDTTFCNGGVVCQNAMCVAAGDPCTDQGLVCDEENDECDCDGNDDCDDSDACTDDACAAGDCTNTDVDCDDADACTTDACDPATGCTNTDVDCDDADNCTTDSCDPATGCANDAVVCPDGQVCDPADGSCVDACVDAADCDDGDLCTDDACGADGFCTNTAADCNDNLDCTDDSCDPATGDCVNADNCPDGQQCDGTTGQCVDASCVDNTDCDDGVFCNGAETCVNMLCTAGDDPCAANETCDEDNDECDPIAGSMLDFTLAQDTLTGTDNADTFNGGLIFNAPTGTSVPSVQTGDSADGMGGADALNATFNFTAGTTIAPTLTSIDTFNVTDFGTAATTIQGTGITGMGTFNTLNSTNTNVMTINSLGNVVDCGITNNTAGLTVSYAAAGTSGTTDSMNLSLSNVQGGTFTVISANSNGIETLGMSSEGVANTLAGVTQTTGTTLTTVNVSGSQNITVTAALPNTVTTLSCANSSAATDLGVQTAGNVTYTGGTGNDTVRFGSTYTSADTINGGTGTNSLGVNSAQANAASTAQSNVTNVQALVIEDALANAVTPANFGSGVVTTNLEGAANGGSLTVTNGHSVSLGKRATNTDSAGTLGVTVSGSGVTDAITLTANDSDSGSTFTLTGVETCNLVSNNDLDGTAADGSVNSLAAFTMTDTGVTETLNVTGASALTFTGAVTADVINAGSFTQALTMSATTLPAAGAHTITGGSGNDTLFGSTGVDTVNCGAGNDSVTGQAGNDILTGSTGTDTFSMVTPATDGTDVITDFTPGTDKFDYNTALMSIDGTVTTPGATGAFQSGAAGTTLAGTTTVFELTGTTIASQSAANVVTALGATATNSNIDAADTMLIIAYTTGGGAGIWLFVDGSGADIAAGELTQAATLSSVAADSLGSTDFQ